MGKQLGNARKMQIANTQRHAQVLLSLLLLLLLVFGAPRGIALYVLCALGERLRICGRMQTGRGYVQPASQRCVLVVVVSGITVIVVVSFVWRHRWRCQVPI